MTLKIGEFAILAPIPINHLESALSLLAEKPYVSFGSMKFELFHEVENALGHDRHLNDVPVLIYPSHFEAEIVDEEAPYVISWRASYFEWAGTKEEMQFDDENHYRPESTRNDREAGNHPGGWGMYWRIKNLERLPEDQRIEIRNIQSTQGSIGVKMLHDAVRKSLNDRPVYDDHHAINN